MKNIFIAVILTISSTLTQAQDNAPISAETIGQLPNISNISLSPDGTKFASFRNFNGRKVLVVQKILVEGEITPHVLQFGKGELNWFHWLNNERLAISVRFASQRRATKTIETRLLAMNWDKTNLVNLTERLSNNSQLQDNVISYLPDDPDHVLIALDNKYFYFPDIFKMNIHTGKRKRIQKERRYVTGWRADRHGIIRLGFYRPVSGYNKLLYRKNKDVKWQKIATKKADNKERTFYFEAFSDDENILYVTAKDEGGRKGIYKYNVEKRTIIEDVAVSDKVDITDLLINRDGKVVGHTYSDERPHSVYYTKFLKSFQKMLTRNFPGEHISVETTSKDMKKYIIKTSSPTNPGTYYFFDLEEKKLSYLIDSYPSVDNEQLSPMHIVSYKARDELEIPAYLSLPKGVAVKKAKKLPTIILPHGGPRSRDYYGYDHWVQFLTARGYAVLQMNYRGSTGYGDDFKNLGKQQWGKAMIDDINDGTQWMIQEGIADPDRICILGWSYGGYAALQAPVKSPGMYKCSISGATVTNMKWLWRDSAKYNGYSRYRKYIKDDDTSLKEISPYHHMKALKVPILMVHGTKDRIVPYLHSKYFVKEMKQKKKNIHFVTLKDGDHHLSREEHRILFLKEVEKFLKKYL